MFPLSKEEFDLAEHYLGNSDNGNIVVSVLNNIKRKAVQLIANDHEFTLLQDGLSATVTMLQKLDVFIRDLSEVSGTTSYHTYVEKALGILHNKNLNWIFSYDRPTKFKFWQFAYYDHKLRYTTSESLNELMRFVHELDVYITVSNIGRKRGFVYANATESDKTGIEITGVYHPCIPNAIANDIYLDHNSNVLFLTGANMAGKSTLMKAFGVAVYLAHMGFPLAVRLMNFTVQNGIYTSINVPDDLNMGYSHFYAEVMRVKKIAIEVASGKKLIVMFDELFKGTNVKDAYDANSCSYRSIFKNS